MLPPTQHTHTHDFMVDISFFKELNGLMSSFKNTRITVIWPYLEASKQLTLSYLTGQSQYVSHWVANIINNPLCKLLRGQYWKCHNFFACFECCSQSDLNKCYWQDQKHFSITKAVGDLVHFNNSLAI